MGDGLIQLTMLMHLVDMRQGTRGFRRVAKRHHAGSQACPHKTGDRRSSGTTCFRVKVSSAPPKSPRFARHSPAEIQDGGLRAWVFLAQTF